MQREIIAIINQKGGAGKTTTAQALGAGLILKGYKILFIDIDGQGNLSETMRADINKPSIMDLITKQASIDETIQSTDNGDIIASDKNLFAADLQINNTGKEYRLKEAISQKAKIYDFIIIDTPPALNILTINALTAANSVIIPAQADIFNLRGIDRINETIEAVRQYCNKNLIIKGILLTRYNERTILSQQITNVIKDIAKQLKTKLFKTTIRECIALKEAQAKYESIYHYAPESNAAADYKHFINEYLDL
jgi:chromosome partitioning protein